MAYGGVSAPFIRYPIATSLLMVGVLFVGLVAYPSLPIAPLPQVDFPTIQVSASLPGASPETMASSVAQPLERQFAQIPGVAQLTSTSSLGSTAITIQFDLNRKIDGAANDVQAAATSMAAPRQAGLLTDIVMFTLQLLIETEAGPAARDAAKFGRCEQELEIPFGHAFNKQRYRGRM